MNGLDTFPALRLEKITKVYPGTVALDNVCFEAARGEVHGLIGKNGAGKSTLVGIVAGLTAPTSGSIHVGNRAFRALTRTRAKEAGIAIVTQEPEVILDLSVAENLFLGNPIARGGIVDRRAMNARAEEILSRYGLDIAFDYMGRDLSLSERQLLLVLKACVLESAQVVILDEASAPLTPEDFRLLRRVVDELRDAGKAIVYISHHIHELLDVCDRLTVLRDGKTVGTDRASNLTRDTLSELILGPWAPDPVTGGGRPQTPKGGRTEILRLEGFTKWGAFEEVGFSLHRGEIVGVAGLRGSGRTELMKAIAGIDPPDKGSMIFKGRVGSFSSPSQALAAGIGYLPEERESEGLIKGFSIRDNITLSSLREISYHGAASQGMAFQRAVFQWSVFQRTVFQWMIDESACRGLAENIFRAVECKALSTEQDIDELSGGNKQKVLIGRIMASRPDLYLLDEPTKGVDIGAKKSILSLIAEEIRGDAGVLLSSPGLDDLIEICDRILVLYKGKIVAEVERSDFDEKRLFMEIQGNFPSKEVAVSCLPS
ncbi:MAG: sugar ABC transporter ATP-binding protein [Synergistaceae bacterium]|jgi:ABC-type sugar transport system ATPase subunit|nr:sugar ABC transporter ATP-binding protein [Synergistaceae bacterium]